MGDSLSNIRDEESWEASDKARRIKEGKGVVEQINEYHDKTDEIMVKINEKVQEEIKKQENLKPLYPEVTITRNMDEEKGELTIKAITYIRRLSEYNPKYYLTQMGWEAICTDEEQVLDFISSIHKNVYFNLTMSNPITREKLDHPVMQRMFELDEDQTDERTRVLKFYSK